MVNGSLTEYPHLVFLLIGPFLSSNEVVDPPSTENTLYVDGLSGSDSHDGLTEQTGLKTLRKAINVASDKTKIFVMDGEYNNNNYGDGVDNGALMIIRVGE